MQSYQRDFIAFALEQNALRLGEHKLKSGRTSPYFFNSGQFNSGGALARLGRYYASAIAGSGVDFDLLFGPAYKGIPLVAAVAIALAEEQRRDVPFCCNRKEIKDHGEGGITFGAPLAGRVLIVDDVISAGTSVNQSVEIIRAAGARPVAVAVALDRQERGAGRLSAIADVEQRHGLRVISIVTLADLIEYLDREPGMAAAVAAIRAYRAEYGA
jgi:orotate phosphoribosyltransferase